MMPERVGIAGAGAIACGLAAVAAQHGPVVVWARSGSSAQRAEGAVGRLCEKAGVQLDGDVTVTQDLDGLAEATFVVEAIVEDAGEKSQLMGRLAGTVGPEAVLATTTSSLS